MTLSIKKNAGWGSDGGGLDGGAVGVWLVVDLGLNNCNIPASFSSEPGNTQTMLSPLQGDQK